MHRYAAPTELVYGPGSLAKLADETKRLGGTRVTLVSDKGLAGAGIPGRAQAVLDAAGIPVDLFTDVPTDPTFDDVDRLVEAIRAFGAHVVVAVGARSVPAPPRRRRSRRPPAPAARSPARRPSPTRRGTRAASRGGPSPRGSQSSTRSSCSPCPDARPSRPAWTRSSMPSRPTSPAARHR